MQIYAKKHLGRGNSSAEVLRQEHTCQVQETVQSQKTNKKKLMKQNQVKRLFQEGASIPVLKAARVKLWPLELAAQRSL